MSRQRRANLAKRQEAASHAPDRQAPAANATPPPPTSLQKWLLLGAAVLFVAWCAFLAVLAVLDR